MIDDKSDCYHCECFYVKNGTATCDNPDSKDFSNYKDGWYLAISPRFGGEYNVYSIIACPICGKRLMNEND